MTDRQRYAAFAISYCMALADALKRSEIEAGAKPHSRLVVKLANLEEHLGRVLDEYRIERFSEAELEAATKLFDLMDENISMLMGVTNETRDQISRLGSEYKNHDRC